MSITTPTSIVVTPAANLTKAPMRRDELATALLNMNAAYALHAPSLLSVIVTDAAAVTLAKELHIPIKPSADGLIYDFRLLLTPSATATYTIGLSYCTAYSDTTTTWTVVFNDAGVATTAATLLDYSNTATIPANAVAVRIRVTPGSGSYEWHSAWMRPSADNTAPTTLAPSGFVAYDDALLSATGAPINTEMINRIRNNAKALLKDRKQLAYCFTQPSSARRLLSGPTEQRLPRGRIHLPHQSGFVELEVYCIAKVNTGTTTGLIRVQQVGGEQIALDADATIQINTLPAKVQGFGLGAYVDIDVFVSAPNTTELRSLVMYWTPG